MASSGGSWVENTRVPEMTGSRGGSGFLAGLAAFFCCGAVELVEGIRGTASGNGSLTAGDVAVPVNSWAAFFSSPWAAFTSAAALPSGTGSCQELRAASAHLPAEGHKNMADMAQAIANEDNFTVFMAKI